MDSKIVQVALNGLENILRLGEQEAKRNGTGINPYCALIEEAYGKIRILNRFPEIIFFFSLLFRPVQICHLQTHMKNLYSYE